ncbi:uncharacterized protein PHALS_01406 [Plasmopara halstedii]|uniref:Uncharacterized protein n=1 Tax=Plasmopara halstedii TaxID=4781 RepID=A0A0P1AUW5_PLAHL|nr:uncharacterized protein PHALS_01406 [Plasmopara halstedii]CEG45080.1 hypothetical protein PHALS_01406 [Plasmopara halstedii]|eukprot:XP_024581449.1 hypothetical protein PHALS_01406 [Plasmopara halstedii]
MIKILLPGRTQISQTIIEDGHLDRSHGTLSKEQIAWVQDNMSCIALSLQLELPVRVCWFSQQTETDDEKNQNPRELVENLHLGL